MKEQKIYDVVVVEKKEVLHETTGVLTEITRNVLFDAKVSAVAPESAKQKALASCKAKNFDDLEIVCNPFPG